MAKAIIQGKTHEVRCDLIIPKNYGVAVLSLEDQPRSTVNLGLRKSALHRYKINAKNPEAAVRRALSLMKESGAIDDYQLEPHEEAPEPPPPKKAAPKPAPKPAPAAAKPQTAEPGPAPAETAKPEAAEAKPAPSSESSTETPASETAAVADASTEPDASTEKDG